MNVHCKVAMYSSSEIGVDRLGFCLDPVLNLVESSEGMFATYWSELISLEKGVLVSNVVFYGG